MIVVTGGAGCIGSALIWALNMRGRDDILVVDDVDHPAKERNLRPLRHSARVGVREFRENLANGLYDTAGIEAVFHLGACSSTTETDWEYLSDNNVAYTKELVAWCVARGIRIIYASSAATYGDGALGYSDAHELFDMLLPLNLYGKSKLDVDTWARDNGYLKHAVGLRYFNVFGPNEHHKGDMKSVIGKKYEDVIAGKPVTLFRSYRDDYADGEQVRDFVYVKDAVAMTLFFLDNPHLGGVFNVGTGETRTWNDIAHALFSALDLPPHIHYVDMPEHLRMQYQYFTRADMSKIRAAGWATPATPLMEAVREYVQEYLATNRHLGDE